MFSYCTNHTFSIVVATEQNVICNFVDEYKTADEVGTSDTGCVRSENTRNCTT